MSTFEPSAMGRSAGPEIRPIALHLLIVDPRELIRNGLRAVFATSARVEVVAEASTGGEALRRCQEQALDAALVALDLPDVDGIDVVRSVRWSDPSGRPIVVVAMADGPGRLLEALQAGAHGFVVTGSAGSEIETAVDRALRGELWLGPAAVASLDAQLQRPAAGPGPEPLTSREREVLALMTEGHTNREIGGRLTMALGTVKVHVEHILGKLDAADRTEASVRAVQLGLLGTRDDRPD